ncbi:MAG: transcription-repair coupling factor [Acidimicrobiales bacterium]
MDRIIGRSTSVLAVSEPGWAPSIAALATGSERRPVLVAVPTSTEADRLYRDLGVLLGDSEVALFPAWETLPFERISPSIETMGRRLETMWRLSSPAAAPQVVVAPVRSLIQRLGPEGVDSEPILIGRGDTVDPTELMQRLVDIGYRREPQVEHRGEVAIRGSIVDVFASTADTGIRIDLWGDEVDRLTTFSIATQRSEFDINEVEIHGCRELLVSDRVRARAEDLMSVEPWGREQWQRLADGELFDGMESWMPWLTDSTRVLPDLLGSDAMVVLLEPKRMRDRAGDLIAEELDLASTLARTWGAVDGQAPTDEVVFPHLHVEFERVLSDTAAPIVSVMPVPDSPDVATVEAAGWDTNAEQMADRIAHLAASGTTVVVCAEGAGTVGRLSERLSNLGVGPNVHPDGIPNEFGPGVHIVVEHMERGFVVPEANMAVLTEAELTGRRRAHRTARRRSRRQSDGFFEGLSPGDYVVHHHHGVGRFAGLVNRSIGGHSRDYLLLDYRGDDKLYVPSDQMDLVRPYSGGDSPSLHRLGGSDFAKAKSRVRSEVNEIAQELVVLYQQRISTRGVAFDPDTPWQNEVEGAFPYELTPDQSTTVEAVKGDMETTTPMDRLVVGDVGFGKTEIALRAAFKAVQSGKQVAVLVPTTLLAAQHFQTFSDRYAPYPIRVEVLSRFLTTKQAREVATAVRDGEVDVLIGTHRILSDDVSFPRLGLLVVDEEQRFGVKHKEAIKTLATNIDVLTLSATPIPRTLEMSLTGIRDLSVLNTPPADRQPILTYVGEYDERAVAEAIRRELLREGQVFFVHNRVQSIDHIATQIRDLVPEARVAVAHGQMDEGSLETIVMDFWDGKYDVLVCTTIIESGIDMPTVNTLVVDRAELLGLGQLHQLRGRVGRSGQRAYAYLFTRPGTRLTEDAYERLKTIGEATDLGSGFRIAMRDLEIRGAGNLLGNNQKGHIAAVGYDLYCQMVSEAVNELNGVEVPTPAEVKLDLPVDALIPDDYVPGGPQRLEAYRRLSAVTTQTEVDDITAEWEDRYGPVPAVAEQLLDVARLRAEMIRVGMRDLVVVKGPGFGAPKWMAKMGPVDMKISQEIRFKRLFKNGVWKPSEYASEGGEVQVGLKSAAKDLAKDILKFFDTMFPEEPEDDTTD